MSATNEMIEKCAQVISGQDDHGWKQMPENRLSRMYGGPSKSRWTVDREQYRVTARRVLQTLMTPTDEMVEAGELVAVRDFIPAGQYIPLVWQAMLEQALEGEGK